MPKVPRLKREEIIEMLAFVEAVFAGNSSPESFFVRWFDISRDEDPDVRELWFNMSYYEIDVKELPESAECYKKFALSYAAKLKLKIENHGA